MVNSFSLLFHNNCNTVLFINVGLLHTSIKVDKYHLILGVTMKIMFTN